jgi:hypothetical protein
LKHADRRTDGHDEGNKRFLIKRTHLNVMPTSTQDLLMDNESACNGHTIKFGNIGTRDHWHKTDGDGIRKGSLRKLIQEI